MITDNNISKQFDAFLVQLHDTQRVISLAKEKSPNAISKLTGIIIEALDSNLTDREADLAADVLIDLTKRLEKTIRAGLSLRLSSIEKVPLRLALHLANDDIEVAAPFLENSPALTEMDLFYIVQGRDNEHWAAVAKRAQLGESIVNLLAEKKDFKTSQNLLKNENIVLSEKALSTLTAFVQKNASLVKEFVKRKEVSEKMLIELYWKVNESERQTIIELCEIDEKLLDQQMQDVAIDFANVALENLVVTSEMQDTARRYKDRGMLSIQKMVRTLKDGQIGLFYALFAEYSNIPVSVLDQVFMSDQGKALAVIAKALDIDRSVFVSFFVQTRKLRRASKGIDHNQLYAALNHFNNVTVEAAKSLMPKILAKV